MNVDDLGELYRAKTDEELLHLANDWDRLTAEAQSVLKAEFSKRRVEFPSSKFLRIEETKSKFPAPALRATKLQSVREFVPAVLRVHREHIWLFTKLTAPAVVLTTAAWSIGLYEVREFAKQMLRGSAWEIPRQRLFLEAALLGLTRSLLSWCAFSFCFAAISVVVEQMQSGYAASISDALQSLRQRLGRFLGLCLLLAAIFAVIEIVVSFVTMGVVWILDQFHLRPAGMAYSLMIYALIGLGLLVFCRFALAIPAFVLDDLGVSESIFRSDELTQGMWLHSSVLLTKSLVGGYFAALLPFWIARWLPLGSIEFSSWLPWLLTAASAFAVTLVEPVIFIGFSLLYLQATASAQARPTAQAAN